MRKDMADLLHHAYELAELAKKETNETARLQLLESISASILKVWNATYRVEDRADTARGIIANVGGGNWTTQSAEWQAAARKWYDE